MSKSWVFEIGVNPRLRIRATARFGHYIFGLNEYSRACEKLGVLTSGNFHGSSHFEPKIFERCSSRAGFEPKLFRQFSSRAIFEQKNFELFSSRATFERLFFRACSSLQWLVNTPSSRVQQSKLNLFKDWGPNTLRNLLKELH